MALSCRLSTEHPLEAGLEKPSAPLEGVTPPGRHPEQPVLGLGIAAGKEEGSASSSRQELL